MPFLLSILNNLWPQYALLPESHKKADPTKVVESQRTDKTS